MKFYYILIIFCFVLLHTVSQTQQDDSKILTPEEKYLAKWLEQAQEKRSIEMDFSVDARAVFQYGLRLTDDYDGSYTQGFLTVIESNLDLNFSFYPDSFSNLDSKSLYRGIYAEILMSDFGVVISNDEGIDFWENYKIYDNLGNPYLPTQSADKKIISDDPEEIESTYENTILYTGIGITEPSIKAVLHFTPYFSFQIANQPEIDNNLSTTLEREGEWSGIDTENSGGFSLVWDYPLMDITFSAISQHNYDYEDPDDPGFRQDHEFGFSLEGEYLIGNFLTYNIYLSYLNFFNRENRDNYYFVTKKGDSTVDSIAAGGMSLVFSPLELLNLGFSGDVSYVIEGDFDRGIASPELIEISGFVYDARIDLPLFYSEKLSIVLSAGTYNYSFRNKVFNEEERNKEYPLDLQLAIYSEGDFWEFKAAILAANILNSQIEYEDYFLGDYQTLQAGLDGSFILGDPNGVFLSPGLAVGYSLGRIANDGYNWNGMTKNYVSDWQDDIFGGELYLEFGFPHTLLTLRYTSLQLLDNQKDIIYSREFRTRDWGVFTFSTEIFY